MCGNYKEQRGNQRARSRDITSEGMAAGTNGTFLAGVENGATCSQDQMSGGSLERLWPLHLIQCPNKESREWRLGTPVSLSSPMNPGGLPARATLCPKDLWSAELKASLKEPE